MSVEELCEELRSTGCSSVLARGERIVSVLSRPPPRVLVEILEQLRLGQSGLSPDRWDVLDRCQRLLWRGSCDPDCRDFNASTWEY